jgi:hypothetical protein
MKIRNPRPWRNGDILVHGLLRSKNGNKNNLEQYIYVNRDLNGSVNIGKKTECILKDIELPKRLRRKNT